MGRSRGLEPGGIQSESGHLFFRDGHDRGTSYVIGDIPARELYQGLLLFRPNKGIHWRDSLQRSDTLSGYA